MYVGTTLEALLDQGSHLQAVRYGLEILWVVCVVQACINACR